MGGVVKRKGSKEILRNINAQFSRAYKQILSDRYIKGVFKQKAQNYFEINLIVVINNKS